MAAENQLLLEMDQPAPLIGLGHNKAPLSEQIAEELAPHKTRQVELLAVAETALIIDDESAAKVVDLVGLIRNLEQTLDDRRTELKRPYLDACRLIDAEFGMLKRPLELARAGEDGRSGLRGMLTTYERKREAEAEAKRKAAEEEQRRRQEEADAAKRAAEAKRDAGTGSVADELEAARLQEEADRLSQAAEAVRPAPVRSHLGTLGTRREVKHRIVDVRKALGWIIKQIGGQAAAEQFARTWIGGYLRGIGIGAVERGVNIPGVEVSIERQANVRR